MRARSSAFSFFLVGLGALAAACTSFPELAKGSCGNGVIDDGEDCDTYGAGDNTACRAPGSKGQCLFDCAPAASHSCPSGYGCGSDAICRAGSGTFRPAATLISPPVLALSLGDFDGDGRADVASETANLTQVTYFDQGFALGGQTTLPLAKAHPTIGHLTTDALADVVVTAAGAADVFRGEDDRTLAAAVYPAFPIPGAAGRLVPIEALPENPGIQLLFIGGDPTSGAFGIARVTNKRDLPTPLFLVPEGADQIAGDVVVGDFWVDPVNSPCEELALAFLDESKVRVFTSCRLTNTGNIIMNTPLGSQKLLPDVNLPSGGTVLSIVTAKVNGDAFVDLLVDTSNGAFVAYGVGDGTFNSQPPIPMKTGDGNAARFSIAVMNTMTPETGFPLAAGDLTGDGFSDLVMPDGILVYQADPKNPLLPSYVQVLTAPQTWTDARVADMNGNALADVLAFAGTTIDFYNGTGTQLVNHATYTAIGSVGDVSIGDFDGDLVNDAVFRSRESDGATPETAVDDVTVMFGRSSGGFPEEPIQIGTLSSITQITNGPFESSLVNENEPADAIADIAVMSTDPTNPTQPIVLSAIAGRADRLLTSPFFLVDATDITQRANTIARFAVGNFTNTSHEDIVALGFDLPAVGKNGNGPPRLWLAPMTGDAEVTSSAIHESATLSTDYFYESGSMQAVDLDDPSAGGLDDVVGVAASATQGSPGTFYIAKQQGGVMVITKQIALGSTDPTVTWFVKVADIDADGSKDVIVHYTDKAPSGMGTVSKLVVLFNKRTGDLDPSAGIAVTLPGTEQPGGVAPVNADTDAALELVVLSPTAAYLSNLSPDGASFDASPPAISGMPGGSAVVAGDIDNDGVRDIAIAVADGVAIYEGVPKEP